MRHLGRDEIGELVSGPVFESFCYEVSPLKYRICIRIARLRFWIGTPPFRSFKARATLYRRLA